MSIDDISKKVAVNQRNVTKALNTLMGIVSGIVCDDSLHDNEIHFLSTWLRENADICRQYPANVIYRVVHEVLQDGVITPDEREHLLHQLKILSGNDFANTGAALPEHIHSVFDDDPTVILEGNVFVLTGEFLYGTRNFCNQAISKRGGVPEQNVTKRTNYLVVGSVSSPDWIVANFGRKIQKAAEMADSGDFEISIVREADWVMVL